MNFMKRLHAIESNLLSAKKTTIFGKELYLYDCIDSTNILARQMALNGAEEGTVVAALSQQSGKGRLGRSFQSLPGGLYFSVILRPSMKDQTDILKLTSLIAVAAAGAIEEIFPVSIGIKWVNDLYIDTKKTGGILCEASYSHQAGPDFVIGGIGINVQAVDFSGELTSIATSLETETGIKKAPTELLLPLLSHLEALYPTLHDNHFLEEAKRRSVLLGKDIIVHENGIDYPARAVDIDTLGRLIISVSGKTKTLCSGEVSVHLM